MCGRYAASRSPADLAVEFEAVDATEGASPGADYNVAPTKPVHAVLTRRRHGDNNADADPVRQLRVLRWGLVPSWAKDPKIGSRLLNARAESAADKPAFRKALAARRCLLPADGWYEWMRQPDRPGKQPYFVTPRDGSVLALAGLYEFWGHASRDHDNHDNELLVTCTVLTTAAVGPLTELHDRMPLVLDRDDWAGWLDPARGQVPELLEPPSEALVDWLELRPVGRAVSRVDNNGPELTAALPDAPQEAPRNEPQEARTQPSLF